MKQVYNAVRYYKHTDMEQMPLSYSIFFLLNKLRFSSYTKACCMMHILQKAFFKHTIKHVV